MKAGIDEAGRGCVIGPLVICAIVCRCSDSKLKSLNVKDSKLLTSKQRSRIEKELRKYCTVFLENITAKKINYYMKRKISLNEVEAMHIARMIRVMKGVDTVYIDCPDAIIPMFSKRLAKYVDIDDKDIVIEHRADITYPIVSAASIIAKEERERQIKEIKKKLGVDFGSGYTSDPTTIKFLKEHINDRRLRPYLRELWKTVRTINEERLQTKLFE